jgi:hypothetical protein
LKNIGKKECIRIIEIGFCFIIFRLCGSVVRKNTTVVNIEKIIISNDLGKVEREKKNMIPAIFGPSTRTITTYLPPPAARDRSRYDHILIFISCPCLYRLCFSNPYNVLRTFRVSRTSYGHASVHIGLLLLPSLLASLCVPFV